MTFKNLSFWGIFKLVLIFDLLIMAIIVPFVLLAYVISPESVTFDMNSTMHVFGLNIDTHGDVIALPIAIILGIIGYFIKSAFLYWLGQNTRLGRVKIG